MVSKILIAKNVIKRFGGLKAVNDVSFEVDKGEILGLIGPNGAGKTTLFNCITGYYKPENGKIIFKGLDITGKPPHITTKLGIVKTHQLVKPFKELTVLENAMIGALFGRRKGITVEEAKRIAYKMLETVKLDEKADEYASSLNIHEMKMLELARALSAEPELLLLDEVLAGLNPKEISDSLKLIKLIKEQMNLTIIMVEHVMHAVMNISDRIIVLHYGKKIAEGSPNEIARSNEVITAYLGNPELALKFVKKTD